MPNYFNAIIVCTIPGESRPVCYKYHTIRNATDPLKKFFALARKKPYFSHINFYNKETKRFVKQIREAQIEDLSAVVSLRY